MAYKIRYDIEIQSTIVFWYKNHCFHRKYDVAKKYMNISDEWFLNGKHHGENGPAVIYYDGTKMWYLNGEFIKRENSFTSNLNWKIYGI